MHILGRWPRVGLGDPFVSLFAATAALVWCGGALAASGDLDPSFGEGGVGVASLERAVAPALARQPDGKLVTAGSDRGPTGEVIAVARFDSAGAPDPAFGTGGVATFDVGPFAEAASQVLVRPDGTILVVGNALQDADGTTAEVVVLRLLADGSLDGTFGTGGIATADVSGSFARSAALQTDGKVVVVGGARSTDDGAADLFVLRFDADGAPDTTFDGDGLVTLDFGSRADGGRAVLVQPDGKIVVAGASFDGPLFSDGAVGTLTRLDASGTPDPAFGAGGSVLLATDPVCIFTSIVLQPDGKVVALGGTGTVGVSHRLFRYDTAGAPDPGFTGDPLPVFPQSASQGVLALQGDGKFVVLGNGVVTRIHAARVDVDGSIDTSFGIDGDIEVAAGTTSNSLAALPEPSGDILVAGWSRRPGDGPDAVRMMVARILGSSPACSVDSDCEVCERCGVGGTCEIGPRTGCTDAVSGKALVKLVQKGGRGNRLTAKWRGSLFGFDPTTSDDLGTCLFHNGQRRLKAVAPAGGTCDALPCWTSPSPGRFAYDDREATPHGVFKVRTQDDRVLFRARGEYLAASPQGVPNPPALGPLGPPLVLQIHAGNGACVEATFDAGRRTTASKLVAKND